jgi:hypothetical protein
MVAVSGVLWWFGDDLVGVCGGLVKGENRRHEGDWVGYVKVMGEEGGK